MHEKPQLQRCKRAGFLGRFDFEFADVQPVDPLELWDAPPFEPTVDRQKEMLFHGRGVSDDKGGLLQPIHVCSPART